MDLIRLARESDRQTVFNMVATVWDGNDYLPEVWDSWLADSRGPLLIGELAGKPVAVAKLTALGPGEDWFEGLRVAPDQRGKGFARKMLERCMEMARERGACSLRYMTRQDNSTMHRIAADLGFRLQVASAWYSAPILEGSPHDYALTPDQLPRLLEDLARSTLLQQTRGLYLYDWCAFALTEERLHQHLARGQVRALPGQRAWAIVLPYDDQHTELAHLEGSGPELDQLCLALRTHIGPPKGASLRAILPPNAGCLPAMTAAGFQDEEYHIHVYEHTFGE